MFHDGFMGGGMWFGWIFWIVIIGLIVFLIVRFSNRSRDVRDTETPIDILKKRYARGEISKEEFENLKKDVEK